MPKEIHFKLERYRSGGSNRFTCPSCGRKKCFTLYANVETGEYVDATCGKCDHVVSCGYHYPPREYYADHPELNERKTWSQPSDKSRVLDLVRSKSLSPAVWNNAVQGKFFDIRWAEKACQRQSPFRTWFEQLPFDAERIQKVLAEYYVGATKTNIYVNGRNYGPAAVFWMVDEQQRVHDAKMIAYTPDGHRVQGWGNSMRSVCRKKKQGPQLEQTEKVLFGLHLITRYPDKVVCIVESEKSALVCACRYPEYLWVATGGCGNLSLEKLAPLTGRTLVVFPDSGEYAKWSQIMKESGHKHYAVLHDLEDYPPNTDIADVILEELGKKDEVIRAVSPCQEIPSQQSVSDQPLSSLLPQEYDYLFEPSTEPCPF